MFRFTRKPSSGSYNQYLAKNRHTVHDTQASQVTIWSHDNDNVLCSLYLSTFNQVCNF